MNPNFNNPFAFLNCSDLDWLEQIFKEQVYPKLVENADLDEEPIFIQGTSNGFYCEIDPIQVSEIEWNLVIFFGENDFKDSVEQFKVFVNLIKEKQTYIATLNKSYLRGIEFSNKLLSDSLINVFKDKG